MLHNLYEILSIYTRLQAAFKFFLFCHFPETNYQEL